MAVTIGWLAETTYACNWGFEDECITCASKITDANAPLFQKAVNSAAEILYALSGRQFGLCELTVRPCRLDGCDPCSGGMSSYRWTPVLIGGEWHNVSCSTCGEGCSCPQVEDLLLPGPIDSIVSVKINGTALDPATYFVDRRRALVARGFHWPKCQDMSLDDDQLNTYSVTYLRGKPLPEAGKRALAQLACELFLDCVDQSCCKLPSRVTSIQREGVSYAMLDPMDFIPNGKTGLYLVDLWLQSVNPAPLSRSGAILSPDMAVNRRTTWTAP